jgi:hypothetical protein
MGEEQKSSLELVVDALRLQAEAMRTLHQRITALEDLRRADAAKLELLKLIVRELRLQLRGTGGMEELLAYARETVGEMDT